MRVGLFGGSFNPPHKGHIYISEQAIKRLRLDQIWWIPTAHNPFKDKSIYDSYENRLAKCENLISKNRKIRLKKFDEIYTYLLLRKLRAKYKNINFFWIMGADNLARFHQWENFKEIAQKTSLAIFSREKLLKNARQTKSWSVISSSKYKIFHTRNINISSTQLRNKNS